MSYRKGLDHLAIARENANQAGVANHNVLLAIAEFLEELAKPSEPTTVEETARPQEKSEATLSPWPGPKTSWEYLTELAVGRYVCVDLGEARRQVTSTQREAERYVIGEIVGFKQGDHAQYSILTDDGILVQPRPEAKIISWYERT